MAHGRFKAVRMKHEGRTHRRLAWGLGLGSAVILGLELCYLVGANLWLRSDAGRDALAGPAGTAEYDSAWSIVPGDVHFENLRLRGRSGSLSYALDVPRGMVDLALVSSLLSEVDIERLEARDADLRMTTATENDFRRRAFPDIEAIEPADETGEPATWSIAELDARFERLWIFGYNYRGPARASGSVALEGDTMALDEFRLAFENGTLHYGTDLPIFENLSATVQASAPAGAASLLERLTAKLELDEHLQSARFLTAYVEPALGVELEEGAGGLGLSLHVKDGRLEPASSVRYATAGLLWTGENVAARGPLSLDVTVEPAVMKLSAHRQTVELAPSKPSIDTPVLLKRLELLLQSSPELAVPERDFLGSLTAPEVQLPNLALLNAWSHPEASYEFKGGRAEMSMKVHFEEGTKMASDFDGKLVDGEIAFGHGRLSVGADGEVTFQLASQEGILERGTLRGVHVQLSEAHVADRERRVGGWGGTLSCDELRYEGFLPHKLSGPFHARIGSPEAVFLALDLFEEPFRPSRPVPAAEIDGYLWHHIDTWDVVIGQLQMGSVGLRGRVRAHRGEKQFALLMGPDHYKLGLVLDDEGIRAKRRADSQWLQEKIDAMFPAYQVREATLASL